MEKWDETYRNSLPFLEKIRSKSFAEIIELIKDVDKTIFIPMKSMPKKPDIGDQLESIKNTGLYVVLLSAQEFLGYVISKDEKNFQDTVNRFMYESNLATYHTKH